MLGFSVGVGSTCKHGAVLIQIGVMVNRPENEGILMGEIPCGHFEGVLFLKLGRVWLDFDLTGADFAVVLLDTI